MEEEANLPEEIIVLILTCLPVKSLIRFTCVSRRFHSLILSDPKFAKSQLQAARDRKTLPRRLIYSINGPRFESLDLETPSFGDPSSVRELIFPSPQPVRRWAPNNGIVLLGSCNGIVFVTFDEKIFYMWNPSINFFKKLPDAGFSPHLSELTAFGVGYLPATDDYRVIVVSYLIETQDEAAVFSSKSQTWKTIELDDEFFYVVPYRQGILVNEALHWINLDNEMVVAFDLGQEEKLKFRQMLLPPCFHDGDGYQNHLGVTAGGCLSVARYPQESVDFVTADWVDVWVMGEYGVRDSWTKLYNLKFSDPPKDKWNYKSVLVLEASMVAHVSANRMSMLVKILREEEGKCSIYGGVKGSGSFYNMIQYQESLLRIDD